MLKLIEEDVLNKMIAERREWNSYTGGTGIEVLNEVKSKLVDLPESPDQNDEIWEEVEHNYKQYRDSSHVNFIDILKKNFTLTRK